MTTRNTETEPPNAEYIARMRTASLSLAPAYSPLVQIDQYLLAKGWTFEVGQGWLAPESFTKTLAMEIGRGHVDRGIAILVQVRVDEILPAFQAAIRGKS